ncbi:MULTISPECIES: head GIN domain-containing protein [unclassified Aureispira]|uniref:head GIN domain-containing protein n=1 Tax=unclassified Aureispira TaxID=2649989 RepID=UPI000697DD68|nr:MULTISPECIES: head GIN domain-containing protein [unclassified Aureispira]WMX16493.1 head GIN domain-containing protein [Aureispira sp. CCB-E]
MKKGFFMFSICLLSFFTSNGNTSNEELGPQISKDFDLASFHGISLKSSFDVSVEYGQQQKVTITGSEEFFKNLEVTVKKGVLFLGMKKGNYPKLNLKAKIIIPQLKFGEVVGSGDLTISSFSNLENLKLQISGSGDIKTSQEVYIKNDLEARIVGSGDIKVIGSAAHSNIYLTGSGKCQLSQLKTNTNSTQITGSGSAKVNATKKIEVHLSGSGSLYYKGAPSIQQSITGSGKLKSYS